jgi:hypothetical protein
VWVAVDVRVGVENCGSTCGAGAEVAVTNIAAAAMKTTNAKKTTLRRFIRYLSILVPTANINADLPLFYN